MILTVLFTGTCAAITVGGFAFADGNVGGGALWGIAALGLAWLTTRAARHADTRHRN